MKLIVCVDKSNGMLFNSRRQSQDSVLREKMLGIIGNDKLFLNAYSAKQFEKADNLHISETFIKDAGVNDFCFIENCDIPDDGITEVYIFNWNRDYPADRYFELDLKPFKKIKTESFEGSSHKKITLEVYKK